MMSAKSRSKLTTSGKGKLDLKIEPEIDFSTRTAYFTYHFSDQIMRHGNFAGSIELYDVDVKELPKLVGKELGIGYSELLKEYKHKREVAGCIWPFEGSVGIAVLYQTKEPKCQLKMDIDSRQSAIRKIVEEFSDSFAKSAGINLSGSALSVRSPLYQGLPEGYSAHHLGEAYMKALGRAMDDYITPDLVLKPGELPRKAYEKRKTGETFISCDLNIDGAGKADVEIETRVDPSEVVPQMSRCFQTLGEYAEFDLKIDATKLKDEPHHVCEDIGIVLGQATTGALGDKTGLRRLGWCLAKTNEIVSAASVDISGRGDSSIILDDSLSGSIEIAELTTHFLKSYTDHASVDIFGYIVKEDNQFYQENLVSIIGKDTLSKLYDTYGLDKLPKNYKENPVQILFATIGRALKEATRIDPRRMGVIPSTKEVIETKK